MASGRMGDTDGAVVATAIDDGVTEEGIVTASCVFDKLEQTMTHPVRKLATSTS